MPLKVKKVTGPTIAASVLFNGSNQYLSIPNTSTMQMGTSDYTVEAWIYPTANGQANGSNIFGQSAYGVSSQFIIFLNSSNKIGNYIEYDAGGGSAGPIITGTTSITLNKWTHIAVSRVSGVTRIFINGVLDASASDAGGYRTVSHNFCIGSQNGYGTSFFTGYISNFRVIKGTGLYASNFTPPTATLTAVTNTSLLTCHDTTIRDASTNNFTITNNNTATVSTVSPFPVLRSVLFNGTSQYLTIPDDAALNFGSSNFTIECWVNLSNYTFAQSLFTKRPSASAINTEIQWYINTDKLNLYASSNGTSWIINDASTSAGSFMMNSWNHVALVRNGTEFAGYINGTKSVFGSSAAALFTNTSAVAIGSDQASSIRSAVNGYISNYRIVKGTALYTASFTPAGPLTAITSCSLLTCNDQTIRDASVNNFTITNNNTATVSTVTPFTAVLPSSMKFKRTSTGITGRSVQFDGVNDYLSVARILDNSTDVTIEAWVRATSTPNSAYIVSQYVPGAADRTIFYILSTLAAGIQIGSAYVESTTTMTLNTWNHLAFVRSGSGANNFSIYINGVRDGQMTYTGTFHNTPTTIGGSNNADVYGNSYFPGYISNLRILKGTALYTSNFTPPTSPLTAIANTALLTCNAATIIDGSSNNFTITNNNGATISSTITPFLSTPGTFKVKKSAAVVYLTQKAIFGYGNNGGTNYSITNLVSNTGIVATDTTGVGTARAGLAAAGYGNDKAIFGYGTVTEPTGVSMTNLISNVGVVATDTTGVGTGRFGLAAAGYGTDKAIFGYGTYGSSYSPKSMTNLVSNTGVVATDTAGVGEAKQFLAAAGYGTDKAIFGYGQNWSFNSVSMTNLVSNTGVVATDTTGVGTPRWGLGAAGYGSDKAIFGYGAGVVSMTNKVSNTGVVSTDTTGVGTAREFPAAAGYGGDKAIFGYGRNPSSFSITNLVSNTGVVATDTTGVGTARNYLAAAGYSLT
jgi:hypothetical protein